MTTKSSKDQSFIIGLYLITSLTVNSRTSAYGTSRWDNHRAAEGLTGIALMEGKNLLTGQVTEVSARLNVILQFTSVRPSLDNLYSALIWYVSAMVTA
jgi:hypothetical protein